jgi:predicted AAA+ superfamily ATPase
MTYLPRDLAASLAAALKVLPVVVVSGLRQSGKSTLLTEDRRFSSRLYITLDDFAAQAAAQSDPESLIASYRTIDEVQRSPQLLPAIKIAVDRAREPGRFLLSGSANLGLIAGISESLAGRAVYLTLHPMTRREINGTTKGKPALVRYLENGSLPHATGHMISSSEVLLGGLPPVCLGPKEGAALWFKGYTQTYVERDVRQLSQVADVVSFRTFVGLAALRTAQVLNISSIARDARLSAATATRYLNLLETSFLIRRLPAFLNNRSSRLIKSPKLYFTDSGLAAYVAGNANANPGALLETYTVQNVVAILEAHLPEASLTYWHEQGRHEVDLVIEYAGKVWAIEVKAASRWSESDLAGLSAFIDRTPQCEAGILAYNGASTVSLGGKLWAVPLAALLA